MDTYKKNYRVCFPDRKVYIARDHKWAFAAWELAKLNGTLKPNATLFHVDSHLDDVPDGVLVPKLFNIKTKEDIMDVTSNEHMKIDNFIWAGFATDSIDKIIYVSNQKYGDKDTFSTPYFKARYEHEKPIEDFLRSKKKKYEGMRVWNLSELSKAIENEEIDKYIYGRNLILDLDLDYFNMVDNLINPEIMPEDEIIRSLTYLKTLYEWDLITVALSPIYCGGDNECAYLYNLFLKVFNLDLNNAVKW